jgi:hypothetical protein
LVGFCCVLSHSRKRKVEDADDKVEARPEDIEAKVCRDNAGMTGCMRRARKEYLTTKFGEWDKGVEVGAI